MGTTLSVVLLIAIVIAVGLLRDSMRTSAVTRWGQAHGFAFVPAPEHDREHLVAWAARFRPEVPAPGNWGIVLRGQTAGLDTTIAEHEERRMSNKDRWHTLAVTRVPGLQMQAVRITQAPASGVAEAIAGAAAPVGRAVLDGLGIEVTERPVVHPIGRRKWGVEVVNEDARAFWSSATQAAAIDAWPHDAELAAIDDYVLVRMPGLINAGRLDELLACADAARALFTQAAAARTFVTR